MQIRKFIVTIHEDGSITAVEYSEPFTKEDRDYLCGRAFQTVSESLNTYPRALWPDDMKSSYLNGASHMMDLLRKAL